MQEHKYMDSIFHPCSFQEQSSKDSKETWKSKDPLLQESGAKMSGDKAS